MNIARSKQYPANYPRDAVAILDAMSFTDGKQVMLLGSMSLRSQQYAGDYDAFERVNLSYSDERVATAFLAKKFKAIIKRLRSNPNAYIGDIKSGLVPEWRIIPETAVVVDGKVKGYNATACRKRVDELLEARIITQAEAKDALALLKDSPSPIELLVARDTLKFHIVRWSALEVLQGHKKIRGGHTYTLEEAFNSPGLTKLDVIGFVENNRYTDFSCIYEFKNNDTILNPVKIDIVNSLKENILYYKATNNPFKAMKREFALAKFKSDYKTLKRLNPILNSDLGRIYAVQSDVGTLLSLLEDHRGIPLKKIHFEIDQFKRRLASIYEIDEVIKAEPMIDADIEAMTKMTRKAPLFARLQSLYTKLQGFLARHTPKVKAV